MFYIFNCCVYGIERPRVPNQNKHCLWAERLAGRRCGGERTKVRRLKDNSEIGFSVRVIRIVIRRNLSQSRFRVGRRIVSEILSTQNATGGERERGMCDSATFFNKNYLLRFADSRTKRANVGKREAAKWIGSNPHFLSFVYRELNNSQVESAAPSHLMSVLTACKNDLFLFHSLAANNALCFTFWAEIVIISFVFISIFQVLGCGARSVTNSSLRIAFVMVMVYRNSRQQPIVTRWCISCVIEADICWNA